MTIETSIGYDRERAVKTLENQREELLKKVATSASKRYAFLYMLDTYVYPIMEDKEVIQEYVSTWGFDYHVQILVQSRSDMSDWVQLFEKAGFELYNDKQDDKDRAAEDYHKGGYLRFNLNPGEEIMDDINEQWGKGETIGGQSRAMGKYAFDIYLDFFPDADADCKITKLGTVKETYEKVVYEITCSEGAREMQALLGLE